MSSVFRPPQHRSDYRLTEIYYQMIPVRDVWFSFLPLESIQSHSPVLYTPYKKPLANFLRRRMPVTVDGTADNADVTQLQTASDDRLLSRVTLGRVKCTK